VERSVDAAASSGDQAVRRALPWWLQAFLIIGALEAVAIGASSWLAPEGSLSRRLLPLAGGTATYSSASDPAADQGSGRGADRAYAGSSLSSPASRVRALNGRVIGAFYLAGAVGLVASYLTRRATEARIFIFGFGFIAGSLLLVTVVYWDDFTADHVPYGWVVSYVVDPLVAAFAIVTLGLVRPVVPGWHRLTPVFLVQAAMLGVPGLVLLLAPAVAADLWPWTLTDVLARVYACFLLGFALGALLAARECRTTAVRPFAIASAALALFVLIGSARHLDLFEHGLREWVWFGTCGLLGVLFIAALSSLALQGAQAEAAMATAGGSGTVRATG
jgi:hypothetical protein